MKITFDDSKLSKYANDDKLAVKRLGKRMAELYKIRLDDLFSSTTLEDVRHLPGNYHELTSNRKGQWSCNLEHPYRLIFEPHEKPIPTNEHGQYIWVKIIGISVIEIVDYH